MTDKEVHQALQKKGTLQKYKDLILMNMKKKEIQNQILLNSQNQVQDDLVILPLNSFKQILEVLEINISDNVSTNLNQLNMFEYSN